MSYRSRDCVSYRSRDCVSYRSRDCVSYRSRDCVSLPPGSIGGFRGGFPPWGSPPCPFGWHPWFFGVVFCRGKNVNMLTFFCFLPRFFRLSSILINQLPVNIGKTTAEHRLWNQNSPVVGIPTWGSPNTDNRLWNRGVITSVYHYQMPSLTQSLLS